MKIYFLGICGTAMGNAALMLQKQGHTIIGTDTNIYPPMSTLLLSSGITLYEGYDAQRLANIKPDLVVIGNVISRGNTEIEWLLETRSFNYASLPELLSKTILQKRKNIVIAGTHGKTTTTSLAAYLLKQAGKDPGFFIGGVPKDLPCGAYEGTASDPFVIEGDEYDTAFFDKRSKFIHYLPSILVINNMEFDHADIFHDLADVKRTFRHATRLVPRNGYIIINGDDSNCQSLFPISWAPVIKVGIGPENDLRIKQFQEYEGGVSFELWYKGEFWDRVEWAMHGLFNARNGAMAALASGLALFPEDPTKMKIKSLYQFNGVKRRQEIIFNTPPYIIIEDFAHHPSAMQETLQSLKNRYPRHCLTACFEPSSYTSKSNVFQQEFAQALSIAHHIFISPIYRQKSSSGLDIQTLAQSLQFMSLSAKQFECNKQLLKDLVLHLQTNNNQPHLVCFFSNGSFGGIMEEIVSSLSAN